MDDDDPTSIDNRIKALQVELYVELKAALAKHAPMHSHHEAYGVIYEELCEYFDQVRLWPKRHDEAHMREELLHIAAMALRAIVDLGLEQPQ